MKKVTAPISVGELIDKITILEIKSERITDQNKLNNINKELGYLNDIKNNLDGLGSEIEDLKIQLKDINSKLWDIEDDVRDHERRKDFGQSFVDLARSVYQSNDKRMEYKGQINSIVGSDVVEEKSYEEY